MNKSELSRMTRVSVSELEEYLLLLFDFCYASMQYRFDKIENGFIVFRLCDAILCISSIEFEWHHKRRKVKFLDQLSKMGKSVNQVPFSTAAYLRIT